MLPCSKAVRAREGRDVTILQIQQRLRVKAAVLVLSFLKAFFKRSVL